MSCSEQVVHRDLETGSRISRFTFIPVIQGKTKTAVSNRIVKALQKSTFCSSSPLIKKLIVQNVQVCCIVIETSGTHSIKIICASVPYLLNLLARANPKFKKILEDEKVVAYLKFFQETDMESLLTSFCTATVIIQKGIKMCYPTFCIQLSRDALLFSESTLKSLLSLFYKGLVYAFHFAWEDLGPALRLLFAQNRTAVKTLAKNLPAYALAGAKGLILFSFLVRRVVHAILKVFKRSVRSLCHLLQESSIDSTIYETFGKLKNISKHIAVLVLSGCVYQYCQYYCMRVVKWCAIYAKDLFPVIMKEIMQVIEFSSPLVKQYTRSALQSVARCLSPDGSLVKLIQLGYNSKPVLHQFLNNALLYFRKIYQFLMCAWQVIVDNEQVIYPVCKRFTSHLLRNLIFCSTSAIRYSSTIGYTTYNFLYAKAYPIVRDILYSAFNILSFLSKLLSKLSRIALRYISSTFSKLQSTSLSLLKEIYPCMFPTVCELNSTATCASNEVIQKSFSGVRRIVPSLWSAVLTVTPVTFRAVHEVLLSSKNSVIVIYPVLLDAAGTVSPDVYQVLLVVVDDGNKAIAEVASVYCAASCQLGIAAKNVSCQLPVVVKAIGEVTVGTDYAIREVLGSSSKASARILRDLMKAVWIVSSSVKAAELEISETMDEISVAVKYVNFESFEVLYILNGMARRGTVLTNKTCTFMYLRLLKLLNVIFFNLKCIFNLYISLKSSDGNSKNNVRKRLKQILSVVTTSFKKLFSLIPACDNLYDKFPYIREAVSSSVHDMLKHMNQFICSTCCKVLHDAIPKSWNFFKYAVSVVWLSFCDFSNDSWELFELISSTAWCFICNNFPEVWKVSKYCCQIFWELTCKVSPDIWNYVQVTVPILWNYNRRIVKYIWNLHLQFCFHSWNVLVPLTSTTWACALNNCPKMWLAISKHSKSQWKLFSYFAEQSWDVVSETSFSSWEIFHKIVAKTWKHGIRPATISACNNMVKSIEFSHSAYTKTEKIIVLLSEGLTATNSRFLKIVFIPSKFEEGAGDIIKRCVDFSRARLLKPNTKGILLYNTVKNLVNVPSQIAETYSEYLNFDQVMSNVVTMTKIPFIPMCRTYSLSQKLLKKYLPASGSYEAVHIPGNQLLSIS